MNFYDFMDFEFVVIPFGGFDPDCLEECEQNGQENGQGSGQGTGKSTGEPNKESEGTSNENSPGKLNSFEKSEEAKEVKEAEKTEETICKSETASEEKKPIIINIDDFLLDFIAEELKEEIQRKESGKGGGKQIVVESKESNPRIRAGLERLAGGATFQKIAGDRHYDPELIFKNLKTYRYQEIINSKYSFKPKEVYFFVDTSGSVSYLGNMIISLIASTHNSKQIQVFSGSEAHANKDEKTKRIFNAHRENMLHESLIKCFTEYNPSSGTTMIFWGDLQGAGIASSTLKQILSRYNPIWLNPSEEIYTSCYGSSCETIETKKVMPVLMGINTITKFVNCLKRF